MKFKSHPYSEASGSIGGTVYAHNRGGQYVRARTIPVDPGSVYQQAVRMYMGTLSTAWSNILTAAQRGAWDNYADQVRIPDRLGDPRNVGGLGMYCRCNVPILQAGLTRVDDGPTTLTMPSFTAPTFTNVVAGTLTVDVGFDPGDAWANEVGGALLVYASRGKTITINYFKGPYRFMDLVAGAASPPTSPQSMNLPFTVTAGQRVFFQARAVRADGRLSLPFRNFGVAT